MRANENNVFKVTLLISICIHFLLWILFYGFLEKQDIKTQTKNNEKIKLAFKRGGDSKQENSKFKENTSISDSFLKELESSSPSQNIQTNPNLSINHFNAEHSRVSKDSAQDKALDLASLQIYGKLNLQNPKAQKYQEALDFIMKQNIPKEQKQEIIDLYGDELGDYGMEEIDFLVNNLREIGRITQYHINRRGYPKEAVLLKQSGKNVLEFFLYPNGDISDLKIITSSKSVILDKDIQTSVKVAFKEYPRPTTKVKIIIYMTYRLSLPTDLQ